MTSFALISVSDKTNIIPLARVLTKKFNYKILSSGGTAKYLTEANIPVIKVSDFTESPEILEGRVKTLHPKIHGGILAKRSNKDHLNDVKKNNISLIDLVIVNLYPFKEKIESKCSWDEAIENIDIGGPSMIRSAAKNHADISVLVHPNQYDEFLEKLEHDHLNAEYKTRLAFRAFEHTASYDAAISNWMKKEKNFNSNNYLDSYPLVKNLRYGENPHQKSLWYGSNKKGWNAAKQLQGKELSHNNLLDLDSALSTVLEFGYDTSNKLSSDKNAAIVVKHNNPCGAAIANSISSAFQKALECDTVSAFGGIVALNTRLDAETASKLEKLFLECVVAPSFEKEALEILQNKKNLRLIELKKEMIEIESRYVSKSILGGILSQEYDDIDNEESKWEISTDRSPSEEEFSDLKFAWKVCKHVKSNGIVIVKGLKTIGIGAGQMNRVGAAEIALKAAEEFSEGAVLASDGFFPFADTIELAHKYGISSIIQPGGSIRDKESIKMANSKNISMVMTQKRHFLH